jgi:hypothetical protein
MVSMGKASEETWADVVMVRTLLKRLHDRPMARLPSTIRFLPSNFWWL